MWRVTYTVACCVAMMSCGQADGTLDAGTDGGTDGSTRDGGPGDGGTDVSNPDLEPPLEINETPCEFGADLFEANETYEIECTLDLGGRSFDMPEGVTLVYAGGQIINGTLAFVADGRIDGNLLNQWLTVNGDVALIDSSFQLHVDRWDIVEGPVELERAFQNAQHLGGLFSLIHRLSGDRFIIGALDAYFETTRITPPAVTTYRPVREAMLLPSNFTLHMSDSTHLRTQPVVDPEQQEVQGGALLSVNGESHVTVIGGHLHGDRDERIYTPDDIGLEGAHLMLVYSGTDIAIDGVHFVDGSAGSLVVGALLFTTNPEYVPSSGITVRNCLFERSRRMSIAWVDGRDSLVENNTFIDTGLPSSGSDGGEVGYAINLEPARIRDMDGNLVERHKAENVVFRRNTERGSRGGFITLSIGQNITIEDNVVGSRVTVSLASGSVVRNNSFEAVGEDAAGRQAIFVAGGTSDTVFGNEVYGNTIRGYSIGIATDVHNLNVYGNDIEDCLTGIQLSNASNVSVYDNSIIAERSGVRASNTSGGGVVIRDNEISGGANHFTFSNLNQDASNPLVGMFDVRDNQTSGEAQVTVSRAGGVSFTGNNVVGGIAIGDSQGIVVSENQVTPNESHGIRIFGSNDRLRVEGNTISEPTGAARFMCVDNGDDNPDTVTLRMNECIP